MNPKAIGELSEAKILARLLELGYAVSIPFGNNQRYDCIVDDGVNLIKAQCKTARVVEGGIEFPCRNNSSGSYRGEAEWFLIYSPTTDKIYKINVDDVGIGSCKLRTEPTVKDIAGIRYAKDYEL